jgi:hypothetical protein
MGIRAGERVSIKKVTRDRIATREVKRLDAPVALEPKPRQVWPNNGKVHHTPIPESKYAAAPVSFPECEEPALDSPLRTAPEAKITAQPQPNMADSLLGRCLCEALNACKIAQEHASKIGLPVVFGPIRSRPWA